MSRGITLVIVVIGVIVSVARWWVGVQHAPLWLDITWWAVLLFLIVSGAKRINEHFR
jgi:hypothetical protein